MTILVFFAAAVAEIAGCFAFWVAVRGGHSIFWLFPGIGALALFASLLTLSPTEAAGRAYAVYGGIYIVASLGWLWIVEGQRPDGWDVAGAALCLAGASLMLWAPRG